MKREETYTSQMRTHVHFDIYEPSYVLRMRGMVFIYHDLAENKDVYSHLAEYLLNAGYVVVCADLPGHGESLVEGEQGYFGPHDPVEGMTQDLLHLQEVMQRRYPELMCFYLGVGFGANILRTVAATHGDLFAGMILVSPMKRLPSRAIRELDLKLLRRKYGDLYRPKNRMLNLKKMPDGDLLEKLGPDVLRRRLNFTYTVKGYFDIYEVVDAANSAVTYRGTPADLPILLMAYGGKEILTRNGKDVVAIYETYTKTGHQDVQITTYANRLHHLLVDQNRKEVYNDIRDWLNSHTYY